MNLILLLLFMCISLGVIYLVHKYTTKTYFYLIAIVYSIISYFMSFKIITIFGININGSIIFGSTLLMLLYYFVNRYRDEVKKFVYIIMISTVFCEVILLINSLLIPSIYDSASVFYKGFVFENFAIMVFYPVSLFVTLNLSSYCFEVLKKEEVKKEIKTILFLLGISFINTFIFVYFSYAFIIRFDKAIMISLGNYFISSIILIGYFYIINRIFKVRKVK